ncbi:hypothetical protein IBTHAUMO2_610004 [Nitrosopumilaceae archaeon]|nr:hypothetical protein IBTHAUMO2_610004 [Nitrosopumilaceae archaeon]
MPSPRIPNRITHLGSSNLKYDTSSPLRVPAADKVNIDGVSAAVKLEEYLVERKCWAPGTEVSWDPIIKMLVVRVSGDKEKVKEELTNFMSKLPSGRKPIGPIHKNGIPCYYIPEY